MLNSSLSCTAHHTNETSQLPAVQTPAEGVRWTYLLSCTAHHTNETSQLPAVQTPAEGVRWTYFHIHSPLLAIFLSVFVLLKSCCSHAQVFGRTLVHESLIFYCQIEWNLLSSLYDNSENILKVGGLLK